MLGGSYRPNHLGVLAEDIPMFKSIDVQVHGILNAVMNVILLVYSDPIIILFVMGFYLLPT